MSGPRAIAIVGMAGRFPGAADVTALWENVLGNRSAARPATAADWRVPVTDVVAEAGASHVDHAVSSRACLLDDFTFDAEGLALPAPWLPRLSRLAQLTLQVGVDAWRSTKGTRAPERTSVILANIALPTAGASRAAEALFLGRHDEAFGQPSAASEPFDAFPSALPAGMLATALGLGGGSFTLDAACASSLYAIHLACGELEAGRADAVLSGGVSLPQSLYTQVGFTQLQALSPSGRCTPYAALADGLVVGEGAAMIVLKRLDDARRDGDTVLGVIRGIGLSNDVGGSLLSPEPEGQLRAMRAAYAEAGWKPEDVDLVEGHGTGTPRGDAVEIASLSELWRGADGRGAVLGSVKGNVGHLLTAAGAAGLCKVLSALRAKELPPSIGADAPSDALRASPFRVVPRAESWQAKANGHARRAAVSGFGFGGINAHLLVEEDDASSASSRVEVVSPPAIAIVGMAAHFGACQSLASFRDAVLSGKALDHELPGERWHGLDFGDPSSEIARLRRLRGGWISTVALSAGRFKIPPNVAASLLPQQLLMLAVAGDALADAGLLAQGPRLRAGAVIGLGLDLETTSFHLRWLARARARAWARSRGLGLDEAALAAWADEIKEALAPSLDATRTLGALGGIVPSRIARELQLGGPSFAVADDEAAGLRAVEVAVRMLQRGDVDAMLAGAVDLAGDIRAVLAGDQLRPFSPGSTARPFDARADGPRVGEGAAAVVLKREKDALADGDRIYAIVRGVGAAGGPSLDIGGGREGAYVRAARSALAEAGVRTAEVGLVETHGSGDPAEDAVEARALANAFGDVEAGSAQVALGSAASTVGQAGAAAGLASFVKAALALHHRVLPPLGDVRAATDAVDWTRTPFHLPRVAAPWVRDRADGPRVALASAMARGGACVHVVLTEATGVPLAQVDAHHPRSVALFLVDDAGQVAALRDLAQRETSLEALATRWQVSRARGARRVERAILTESVHDLLRQLDAPHTPTLPIDGTLAFVFPGSGNHFLGMGREVGLAMPSVLRALDDEVRHLAGHLQPRWVTPRRVAWPDGWEEAAAHDLASHPERVILAQVAHGIVVHDALRLCGLTPDAFIGYSLGESAALLASRTWRDRDTLFERTLTSPLFRSELCGERTVLRDAWGDTDWRVVIVTRPASEVRTKLTGTAALLIVNAPRECVIGGRSADVDATVAALSCEAIPLGSVPTVHLPVMAAVKDAYRAHHRLPTTPPEGARFYSGAWAQSYVPTEALAADSIVDNAIHGFDFPAVIERAWADGVRVFVEVGPQGSCTRMISRILGDRPHLAVTACQQGEDGYRTLLAAVARVAEAGVAVDLDGVHGMATPGPSVSPSRPKLPPVVLGGVRRRFPEPPRPRLRVEAPVAQPHMRPAPSSDLASFFATAEATTAAHTTFLRVAQEGLALQARLLAEHQRLIDELAGGAPAAVMEVAPLFDRAACLELAVGKLSRVLGPEFADVDALPTRVRLPDEPLMLVDRIVSVEGTMGTLGPGRVVTEHDVHENAWYLDGDRAPVCISVEAGQADLFLSGYLGIDRETRGERVYRLLDAKIAFHRDLPRPGERIRYDIRIDRFLCQGETWLFFFRFEGSIAGVPFITMFDGCAGFFSPEQLAAGAGIVPRAVPTVPLTHPNPEMIEPFRPLVPTTREALADDRVDALRRGDLEMAFGPAFAGKTLAPALRLPSGRMKLVDRIVSIDPNGGPKGRGEVVGEADVTPDAWYLTCHFIDDQVMPGTLMYECCLHTLRVLLLRLGWVVTDATVDAHYGPVLEVPSELRCRGQVTRETKKVRYRVSLTEIGYDPEPFVLATASMFADDKHVVQMEGMSVRLRRVSRAQVEAEWASPMPAVVRSSAPPAYTREQVVAYAEGNPSECFGPRYAPFDRDRRLARLPRDPYLFVDRVVSVEPPPWVLAPGGWVTCAHDVPPDAWYFAASRQRTMPFAVLLEAALQPCGWLAAYLGSALTSDLDLQFRNLDGHGTQHEEVFADTGTLTTRARLTKTSQAGGMILQEFDLEVLAGARRVYVGQTGFGFFPAAALAAQVGLRGASSWAPRAPVGARDLVHEGPLTPEAAVGALDGHGLLLPATAFSMIDRVEVLDLTGGPAGLGLMVGTKRVNPEEWFFRAHFYQDPVMPGSLGLEALLELVKVFARERFPALVATHRFEVMALGRTHRWQYRGQVIPTNTLVRVEARVTSVVEGPEPLVVVDGQLSVDEKTIYSMKDFAVRLVAEAA